MKDIKFVDYAYKFGEDSSCTLFLFYPDNVWDEDKSTLLEALEKYPPTEYNWVRFNE